MNQFPIRKWFIQNLSPYLILAKDDKHTITMAPSLRPGIYAPAMTFFDSETEDVDIPTVKSHAVRLAKAGLAGLITMGSNGEAVHLSRSEKQAITRATRDALDEAGYKDVSVMVGCSAQSVRGTIELCKEAAESGGDSVLLIPPSYYRYAMTEEAIYSYFTKVADASPVPLILYNYPGAVAGIDMDSDFILKLSAHPNIVGTKFTCGNTGKLARVALEMDAITATSKGSGYMAFAGMADFLLQGLLVGGSGVIAGGANVAPKACVKVFNLFAEGKIDEAIAAQKRLSKGDWVLTKAAIPGTKSAIQSYFGYGGYPRQPLQRLSADKEKEIAEKIKDLMEWENSL
ncbi:aldolase [Choiromyces venosus 120613-1]|uniref:Aldolase n=1 Tax=Choiromyces venosus 120613-1 TaxID=1336337 RepID=A0A3N4IX44_9PEZI|nr:aldolase [Choiromyces venosus 120613-1]